MNDAHSASAEPIRRLQENLVYKSRFAAIYDDVVAFPDGTHGNYLRIVESQGKQGVAILPVCEDQIALVRVYRYPLGSWEWGIPRGFAHGTDPEKSARNELEEELGQGPDRLLPMGTLTPNSGLLASSVKLFLAQYAAAVSQPVDRQEVAEVRWVSTRVLCDEIAHGQIKDAFTLSALVCAKVRGHITSMAL